jgi:hypothetical protein
MEGMVTIHFRQFHVSQSQGGARRFNQSTCLQSLAVAGGKGHKTSQLFQAVEGAFLFVLIAWRHNDFSKSSDAFCLRSLLKVYETLPHHSIRRMISRPGEPG